MNRNRTVVKSLCATIFMLTLLLMASIVNVSGHGGKTHTDEKFTAFEALEKGVALFNSLVEKGKLEKSWKKDLVLVKISHMEGKDNRAYGISFHRSNSSPPSVYIFFKADGSYGGSNYTGE
jgi:hypothetical protein